MTVTKHGVWTSNRIYQSQITLSYKYVQHFLSIYSHSVIKDPMLGSRLQSMKLLLAHRLFVHCPVAAMKNMLVQEHLNHLNWWKVVYLSPNKCMIVQYAQASNNSMFMGFRCNIIISIQCNETKLPLRAKLDKEQENDAHPFSCVLYLNNTGYVMALEEMYELTSTPICGQMQLS